MSVLQSATPSAVTLVHASEQWVPYVPTDSQTNLEFSIENDTAFISVTITFYDGGFNVSDWGPVTQDNNYLSVDAQVWDWTGAAVQWVWDASRTLNLGSLGNGSYTFSFKAWGHTVKSVTFHIGTSGDVNYDGKVDIRDVAFVAIAFGSYPDHPSWNPEADVNQDSIVDIRDMAFVAIRFGTVDTV